MLINILCLIIGVALTLVWMKLVKPKTPLNFQVFVKDKFWLITTGSLIVAIGYLYFYLPQVFEWLAVEFWGVPSSTITEDGKTKVLQLTDLGPLGDIYGSLNTLFTSATLAFVVYATLLQRQANHDAREAMAKQLQQAREDTEKQLEQAREATEQQILNAQRLANLQLQQASEASDDQLNIAKQTYSAQIEESRISFFTSQFYSLLNYKNEKLKELCFCKNSDEEIKGLKIFSELKNQLIERLIKCYTVEKIDDEIITRAFNQSCKALNSNELYYELFSYLEVYSALAMLINSSPINSNDKNYYQAILRSSMSGNEQFCIFLIAPMWERLYIKIKLIPFFNAFGPDRLYEQYALKFYSKNNFALLSWDNFFDNNQTRP